MSNPVRHQWRLLVVVATLFLLMAGVTLLIWSTRDSGYAARFERRVHAEVPLRSREDHVWNWLRWNCKYAPTKITADTMDFVQGRPVTALAGIPKEQVASCIRSTVPREDWISDSMRVYVFLDRDDKVIGYYFLTVEGIAEMEAQLSSLPLLPPSASPAGGFPP